MGGERIDRGEVVTAVGSLRVVLASIEAGQFSCSVAYRTRLQGAVAALESLSGVPDVVDTPEVSEAAG